MDVGRPYRCQLVKACKELIEGHDQLLGRALGRQTGETLDVGKQDAAETQRHENPACDSGVHGCSPPSARLGQSQLTRCEAADWTLRNEPA